MNIKTLKQEFKFLNSALQGGYIGPEAVQEMVGTGVAHRSPRQKQFSLGKKNNVWA